MSNKCPVRDSLYNTFDAECALEVACAAIAYYGKAKTKENHRFQRGDLASALRGTKDPATMKSGVRSLG